MVVFKDPDVVEKEEKPDEFKKMLVSLKEEIYKLENYSDEDKFEMDGFFELLEKVDDEKLKDSIFIIGAIIDSVEKLVEKYESQDDLDKDIKKIILEKIENIREHIQQV